MGCHQGLFGGGRQGTVGPEGGPRMGIGDAI